MTILMRVLLTLLLICGIGWGRAAEAQGLPSGSYLRSCGQIQIAGDTLYANCRTAYGGWQYTSLPSVSQCVGDIGNNNGNLQCNYRGGRQPPPPGYGGWGGAPAPYYGRPREPDWRGECDRAFRRVERLRAELSSTWDPEERERLRYRLREAHARAERCR